MTVSMFFSIAPVLHTSTILASKKMLSTMKLASLLCEDKDKSQKIPFKVYSAAFCARSESDQVRP